LIFLSSMILILAMRAAPARAVALFVVDDDGLDCPNPDTNTITDALALAHGSPATITVCPGFYPETVVVNFEDSINLIAPNGAILPAVTNETIIVENSRNILVQRFIIVGPSIVGAIRVTDSENIVIDRNLIDGQNQNADNVMFSAIRYVNATGSITNNEIVGWHSINFTRQLHGISVEGNGGQLVTIADNHIADVDRVGINVLGDVLVEVNHNFIDSISPAPAGANFPSAITVWGAPGSVIRDNIIRSNAFPAAGEFIGIVAQGDGTQVGLNHIEGASIGIVFSSIGSTFRKDRIAQNEILDTNRGIFILCITPLHSSCSIANLTVSNNVIVNKAVRGTVGILLVASGNQFQMAVILRAVIRGNQVAHFTDGWLEQVGFNGKIIAAYANNKFTP